MSSKIAIAVQIPIATGKIHVPLKMTKGMNTISAIIAVINLKRIKISISLHGVKLVFVNSLFATFTREVVKISVIKN